MADLPDYHGQSNGNRTYPTNKHSNNHRNFRRDAQRGGNARSHTRGRKAEVASNRASSAPTPGVVLKITVDVIKIMATAQKKMAMERYTVAWSMRRRSRVVSSLPRSTLNTVASSTMTVVVFAPPPVDAGDAPTNIIKIVISLVTVVSNPRLMEAKPAVRELAVWKKAALSFSKKFSPSSVVLWYSNPKIKPVPRSRIPTVEISTMRE